nr:hypothetical protein [Tanacetum cinerariifolium]
MSTQLTPPNVSPVDINPINSSADEEGETKIHRCENEASIQKSNVLATFEKEMETRDFNKKFYNSIGRVPKLCSSSSIGDENPTRSLRGYSKPSHEGYKNTIELPVGNNMVPLRSDTIRLVQNECSFYGLRSEDPNQHLKDFLKLVDSLNLDDENPICTLRDYSKPSHEGYRNTIELLVWNNVVPLRPDTIRLVQNGCSFHELQSEDPNQHLKDFLKLVNLLNLDGSITTWEDLTTRFLAQLFPPRRTAKLRNDILMFQQHHEEYLSEAWTRFKVLLQKVPHNGIDHWLQIQNFYDHVSFHLKSEINRAGGGKLCNKNADESWEIIKNVALNHESWNDTKEFVKSSTHIPHAYSDSVYSKPHTQNHNEPPKLNPFTFCKRTGLSPQCQALGTTFEARVRDYMAAHTERIERFENAIFKQREEINDRMTEMFELLRELMTSRTLKKVLIREESKFPVTNNINSISLARGKEERSNKTVVTPNNTKKPIGVEMKIPVKETEKNSKAENESIKNARKEETTETPSSQGGAPQDALKDQRYFNSRCSRHIKGNISYFTDFKEHDGGYVAFGEGAKGGKITSKGTIRTATKDETSGILKSFITDIENLVEKKEKIIKCDNRTDFKNIVMNEFCEEKGGGPEWLFDLDALSKSMNYKPVSAGTNFNDFTGKGASFDAVSPIPFTRIYKDHPKEHIIGEVKSVVQTRKMAKQNEAGLISFINK